MHPVTDPDGPWPVEYGRGDVAGFHGRVVEVPVRRQLWWFETGRPTVVLGSTQRDEVVDAAAAASAGVDVVRRRSGGGAVWLAAGVATWIDVILPADDPLWDDDIGRSAQWLGAVWVDVLAHLGVDGANVHTGAMAPRPHDRLVCFAGLAPGEVTVDGAKVVGVSQRRTRHGARFQCAVLHEWDPAPLMEVLALSKGERAQLGIDLAGTARGIGPITGTAILVALRRRLLALD